MSTSAIPVETAQGATTRKGADEIVFYDITASSRRPGHHAQGRGKAVASQIFIPFSVGGGISTVADMRDVLLAGAEEDLGQLGGGQERRTS
jgi:imidazole glycerol-phosphate synthase subunit HisF